MNSKIRSAPDRSFNSSDLELLQLRLELVQPAPIGATIRPPENFPVAGKLKREKKKEKEKKKRKEKRKGKRKIKRKNEKEKEIWLRPCLGDTKILRIKIWST